MADTCVQKEKKEERQLSLFSNERHEDLAAMAGTAIIMILTVILL